MMRSVLKKAKIEKMKKIAVTPSVSLKRKIEYVFSEGMEEDKLKKQQKLE